MRRVLPLLLLAGTATGCVASGRAASPAASLRHDARAAALAAVPAAAIPVLPPAAPTRRRVVVIDTEIEVLAPIEFIADSTAIAERSLRMIDAMVTMLRANDGLRLVEVGVSIGDGVVADRDERQRLASDRANVLVEALFARGVARERLLPVGSIDAPSSTSLSILDRAP